jgi:hypothetical protein
LPGLLIGVDHDRRRIRPARHATQHRAPSWGAGHRQLRFWPSFRHTRSGTIIAGHGRSEPPRNSASFGPSATPRGVIASKRAAARAPAVRAVGGNAVSFCRLGRDRGFGAIRRHTFTPLGDRIRWG